MAKTPSIADKISRERPLINKVVVRAAGNSLTALTVDVTNADFTEILDASNAFDGVTYTVQNSDSILKLSTMLNFNTTISSAYVCLYKNGAYYKCIGDQTTSSIHKGDYTSSKAEFIAGDLITFRIGGSGGTLASNTIYHYLNIIEEWE